MICVFSFKMLRCRIMPSDLKTGHLCSWLPDMLMIFNMFCADALQTWRMRCECTRRSAAGCVPRTRPKTSSTGSLSSNRTSELPSMTRVLPCFKGTRPVSTGSATATCTHITCDIHYHWKAVVSCSWVKASVRCLQASLYCAVLCHIVSLQCLSRSSLHRLAGLPCRLFLSYGLQVVAREVHRLSLRRLICPAQDHFIFLTVYIIWLLSSPWSRCWSFYLCMWCLAYFFPFWFVRPQVYFVLVWSVSRSLHHKLYTCLFRQMAMLRLKISLCLAYAAQTAMIIRVSLYPGSFPCGCIVVPSTSSLGHFLSAHCSRL